MADILSFIIKADNKASPEFTKLTGDIHKVVAANRALDLSHRDLGTATQAASTATSKLLGTLRETSGVAGKAEGGIDGLGNSAKRAAKGGMQELASQVPVVGSTLADLAGKLSGFPLLLGGIVGVGVGVISFLREMDKAAQQNLESITALSKKIGTDFQASLLSVQKIRAEASQNKSAAIDFGFKAEVEQARVTADQRIEIAKNEYNSVMNNLFASLAQRKMAYAKYTVEYAAAVAAKNNAELEAEAKHNAALIELARARLDAVQDLYTGLRTAQVAANQAELAAQGKTTTALNAGIEEQKNKAIEGYNKQIEGLERLGIRGEELNTLRRAADTKLQADLVSIEAAGADKRKTIVEGLTTAAIATTEKLGGQFSKLSEKLGVAKFLQDTQEAINKLNGLKDALKNGDQNLKDAGVSMSDLDDEIKVLTDDMQVARTKGFIPIHESAKKVTEALTETTGATKAAADSIVNFLRETATTSKETIDLLDALIAKGKAVQEAAKGGATKSGTTGGGTTSGAGTGSSGNGFGNPGTDRGGTRFPGFDTPGFTPDLPAFSPMVAPKFRSSGGTFFPGFDTPGFTPDVPQFAHGGIVPGRGPVRAIVHGGEEVIPANDRGRRSVVVNFTVNNTGTVVQQDRDWDTVVEELRQRIGAV